MIQENYQLLPIFDSAEYFTFNSKFPDYLSGYKKYHPDYIAAHDFLHSYKDNHATYNAYRREVERLLHWAWNLAQCSIFSLRRAQIEDYVRFCQRPLKSWIGTQKPPRFIEKDGERVPNSTWRPFVVTVSKEEIRQGRGPNQNDYRLSDKAIREIFTILNSFYNFLVQENYTEIHPVLQARLKNKLLRQQRPQPKRQPLSEDQQLFVIETARQLAEENKRHERTLFIMSTIYFLHLRISQLVENDRWIPKMNNFHKDPQGNWWFTTIGKGNEQRKIAVSEDMLEALKRWRNHLGFSDLLPKPNDQSPLIPKERGSGGIVSKNQLRNIVRFCYDKAAECMKKKGSKTVAVKL